ncbi:amino acid/amide ABC transporter membrane protein 1, HAAT family [Tistlia consotensis]|uniref:Amino acid/amide ABC transporter membrane protein 1, HAAT family n=1 Tax=Tistlia consotensis USBA 355 TaxID=560819 RepID=A0A1Y6CHV2_9PROT|nr:branched-chain amino acid ABC transporter permease [Tistlia consotensis]SMF55757.1 amino acid/amide ABC transporter membrane protein 1, HAAT family [Tistlia consotensis USBA 355]SNR89183.1 amino acid/amide ABC transporter membrane protein 1, HAAT family [Tistlia consotensis]
MNVAIQILSSGLTLGAIYALSTIGLSLVYGSLNMLNMAHGALLALGGYVCFYVMGVLGLPGLLGVPAAMLVCGLAGFVVYQLAARPMLASGGFETRIFIATIGIGAILGNVIQRSFGPQPVAQPLALHGALVLGEVYVPYQNLLILFVSVAMMAVVALLLGRTRVGRAIRATAQNRDAAQLMGIRIGRVYAQVLALSGALAALSGILISSLSGLLPNMGGDPMLKAFVICIVAGLGNVFGAVVAAFLLGLLEALIQYLLGVQYSFAILLLIVIAVLIWRPAGLFGRRQVVRL